MVMRAIEVQQPIGGRVIALLEEIEDVVAWMDSWLQSRNPGMYIPACFYVYEFENGSVTPNLNTMIYPVQKSPWPGKVWLNKGVLPVQELEL